MNPKYISRRDFLKLALLTAATGSGLPYALRNLPQQNFLYQNQASPAKPGRPNFLIVLLDALSATNMSLYGYRRETTPNIARFAERAMVYHQHYAGGNFTVPGTASLLTGTLPWTHRGLHLNGAVLDPYASRNVFSVLTDEYTVETYTHNPLVMDLFNQFQEHIDRLTLQRALAILDQQTSDYLFDKDYWIALWGERIMRGSGLKLPGWLFLSYTSLGDDFDPYTPKSLMQRYGDQYPNGLPNNSQGVFFTLDTATNWIQSQATSLPKPFLGYYHLLVPHEPYKPSKNFLSLFNDNWSPPPKPRLRFSQNWDEKYISGKRRDYDQYLAYADDAFGKLYEALQNSGVLEDTYLILTADHGQMFERGIHGHLTETLYQPVVHIPLIIAKPGQKERQDFFVNTSAIDLLPSLAVAAGRPIPDWCEGQALPGFPGGNTDPERSIYVVEAKRNSKFAPLTIGTTALVKDRYKMVRYFGYGPSDAYEVYDLLNDPSEMDNRYISSRLADRHVAGELQNELTSKLNEMNGSEWS